MMNAISQAIARQGLRRHEPLREQGTRDKFWEDPYRRGGTRLKVLRKVEEMGSPSYREIGEALGGLSKGNVAYHVKQLVMGGYLTKRRFKQRSLRVTERGRELLGFA